GRSLPRRCASMPSERFWLRYRLTARSAMASSPAWPARTGLGIPASWPSAGKTGPRNCPRRRDPRGRDQPLLLPFRLIAGYGKIAPPGQEDRILARGTDHDWSSTSACALGPDSPRERRTG